MFSKLQHLKSIIATTLLIVIFASCKNNAAKIVAPSFADSLITHYSLPAAVKNTAADILFWKKRIDTASTGLVNESRYASALIGRFHQFGDVNDIKMADSIMRRVNAAFNYKEASPNVALCGYSILQHRFTDAADYLEKARLIGLKKYEALTVSFDVDFELGRHAEAASYIKQLAAYKDYAYFFRKSKLDHLNGEMDSAVQSMLNAAAKAESSEYLKNVALANAADLYIHAGRLQQAYDLYKQCIKGNSADYHSIMGIGWIALVHDKNDSLAQQLFEFVHANNKLPDPLFKLYQAAQQRGDSTATATYAQQFVDLATGIEYGNMYNKYVIELYNGILHEPAKAVVIARRELANRSTPQTNAWYAFSLLTDNKKEAAYKVYQQSVSGKPLEGLELYWMGKLMQALDKGFNAKQFFEAAYKNKYDLSPAVVADLEKNKK